MMGIYFLLYEQDLLGRPPVSLQASNTGQLMPKSSVFPADFIGLL